MINMIELENIALLSSHFDISDIELLKAGGKIELSCEANIDDEEKSERFKITAKIRVRGLKDDAELFSIENKYKVNYRTTDAVNFYSNEEEKIVHCCLSLIYLSLREDVLYTLSKAGVKQVKLPFNLSPPIKK